MTGAATRPPDPAADLDRDPDDPDRDNPDRDNPDLDPERFLFGPRRERTTPPVCQRRFRIGKEAMWPHSR
jgi:hypothetical protein